MKRLLIVVDFQKDFVDGSLGFEEAKKLEAPIAAKINAYRNEGDELIFTFDTHTKDYAESLEGRYLPIAHCIKGSEGWQPYGKIADLITDRDMIFMKPAFGSIELAEMLKRRQDQASELSKLPFKSIELVGLVSNICVLSNAVIAKAACPNVPVIVDAACTASFDASLHEKALDIMEGLHIEVSNRTDSGTFASVNHE